MMLGGLLAVTVAFAAASSAKTVSSVRDSAAGALPASSQTCKADAAAGTITYITPFGYSASPGIIDIFEAKKLGYFKDLCLNVQIEATPVNNAELVGSDRAQVSSTAGAANLFTYDATGGNHLVGVETIADINTNSIVANHKFKSLKQLEHQKVGFFEDISVATIAMFEAAHVPINSVNWVSLTDRDPTIIQGTVAAFTGFVGNQNLTLTAVKVPFTQITATQLGVKGTTNVMYMNKTFVAKHGTAAISFIRAQTKALDYCLSHQSACVDYLSGVADAAGQGSTFGLAENGPVWKYQAATALDHGTKPLGTFTANLWEPEYKQIVDYGTEANKLSGINQKVTAPPLASMMDNKLVASIYNRKGQLVWP